jgi:hypothetical protein
MVSAKQAIRWWNSLLFLVVSFLLISCSQTLPEQGTMCTLIGCAGGVTIEFPQLPPGESYEVQLSLPSGETKTLRCGEGTNQIPFEMVCTENEVFFALPNDAPPPEQISITVTADGETFSREFSPVFEKFQPNGEDCPPVCYNATVQFQLSQ